MGDITVNQMWLWLLGLCSAVAVISKAARILAGLLRGRQAAKIKALEDGQQITMQALLALVNHEIDGNNIQGLKDIRTRISDYLIER